jgi:hypothetical protein
MSTQAIGEEHFIVKILYAKQNCYSTPESIVLFHFIDTKGLRLRVFLNRIEADSIKITNKKLQFNFD